MKEDLNMIVIRIIKDGKHINSLIWYNHLFNNKYALISCLNKTLDYCLYRFKSVCFDFALSNKAHPIDYELNKKVFDNE